MGKKRAYMPFFVRDWRADSFVQQLSFFERGVYLEMLFWDWLEGGIPSDLSRIKAGLMASQRRTNGHHLMRAILKLSRLFTVQADHLSGGRIRHPRNVRGATYPNTNTNTNPNTNASVVVEPPERPPKGDPLDRLSMVLGLGFVKARVALEKLKHTGEDLDAWEEFMRERGRGLTLHWVQRVKHPSQINAPCGRTYTADDEAKILAEGERLRREGKL